MADEDNRKTVEVDTDLVQLKFSVKGGLLSTQAAVFIAAGALWLFSTSPSVQNVAKFAIILDIVAIVLYFALGRKKNEDESDEDTPKDGDGKNNSVDTEVTHKKSTKSSVKSGNAQIKKKVPIPNPNASRTHGHAVASVPKQEEPVPMEIPKQEETMQSDVVEQAADAQQNEAAMDGDWAEFF